MKSAPLLVICALAISACSSVAVREGLAAPVTAPSLTDSAPVAASAPIVAVSAPAALPAAASSLEGRSAGPSSMQVLGQLVTTQALLVSLLLAPLSKDSASEPMARVDAASTSSSPLR